LYLNNGETPFFFDIFERPIRVTIIQRGNPGFYTTARNITLLLPGPHDDIFIQSFKSHHLFPANMNPLDTDKIIEDATPEPASMSVMKWGPMSVMKGLGFKP